MGKRPVSCEGKTRAGWMPALALQNARRQFYKDTPVIISMIRTSMTFVCVGPVMSKSPRRSKNG